MDLIKALKKLDRSLAFDGCGNKVKDIRSTKGFQLYRMLYKKGDLTSLYLTGENINIDETTFAGYCDMYEAFREIYPIEDFILEEYFSLKYIAILVEGVDVILKFSKAGKYVGMESLYDFERGYSMIERLVYWYTDFDYASRVFINIFGGLIALAVILVLLS